MFADFIITLYKALWLKRVLKTIINAIKEGRKWMDDRRIIILLKLKCRYYNHKWGYEISFISFPKLLSFALHNNFLKALEYEKKGKVVVCNPKKITNVINWQWVLIYSRAFSLLEKRENSFIVLYDNEKSSKKASFLWFKF